ncbi:MAG: pilin [Minisyncoccota bacterium]
MTSMSTSKKIIASIAAFAAPVLVFAQIQTQVTDVNGVFRLAKGIMDTLTGLFVGAAIVFFLWTIVKFVMSPGDSEKRDEARAQMLYSIIAIFVMVSVWALVHILVNTLGGNNQVITPPVLP